MKKEFQKNINGYINKPNSIQSATFSALYKQVKKKSTAI
jgi:hypothetical protein